MFVLLIEIYIKTLPCYIHHVSISPLSFHLITHSDGNTEHTSHLE